MRKIKADKRNKIPGWNMKSMYWPQLTPGFGASGAHTRMSSAPWTASLDKCLKATVTQTQCVIPIDFILPPPLAVHTRNVWVILEFFSLIPHPICHRVWPQFSHTTPATALQPHGHSPDSDQRHLTPGLLRIPEPLRPLPLPLEWLKRILALLFRNRPMIPNWSCSAFPPHPS